MIVEPLSPPVPGPTGSTGWFKPVFKTLDKTLNVSYIFVKSFFGEMFTPSPGRMYINCEVDYFDVIGIKEFTMFDLCTMIRERKYNEDVNTHYHFRVSQADLDNGLNNPIL